MKRFNNFRLLNVFSLETEHWEYELHKHNFYELIFVEKGSGTHLLNGTAVPYKKGDVMLLTPEDAHEFEISKRTVFTYLKFDEKVFAQENFCFAKAGWANAFKQLLVKAGTNNGFISFSKKDSFHAFQLVHMMKHEFEGNELYEQDLLISLFGSLVMLIVRNINDSIRAVVKGGSDIEKLNSILSYIRVYALDNGKMKIAEIAAHFHMSPNYISIYVKKHTGLSIQQHAIQARLKSAERLLRQKKLSINEVAFRLGFNDASHFNKIFRKYKQTSPGKFHQLKAS